MSIITKYFHIKGTPTADTSDSGTHDNYIEAFLDYTKGKGYTWSIHPIGRYTIYDEKFGNAVMNAYSFGLFSEVGKKPEIYKECLVECNRRSKFKENLATVLFNQRVVEAVTDRLGYDIELD